MTPPTLPTVWIEALNENPRQVVAHSEIKSMCAEILAARRLRIAIDRVVLSPTKFHGRHEFHRALVAFDEVSSGAEA